MATEINDVKQVDINPESVKPRLETYEQRNLEYRGTENHGVEPPEDYYNTDDELEYSPDDSPPNVTLAEDTMPDPVPVIIVEHGTRERKRWRTVQYSVSTTPLQIAGQRENRTRILIANLTTDTLLYVSNEQYTADSMNGFPVDESKEPVELFTDGAVYATAATGIVLVSVAEEYLTVVGNDTLQ